MLFAGHTAEDNYNFTSTAEQSQKPDVTDIESDGDEREMEKHAAVDEDEDLQMLNQSEVEQVQVNQRKAEVEQVQVNQRKAEVEHVQVNQRKVVGPSTNKPHKRKNSPKNSGDGLVGVMERFVKVKEQEANHEATQDFSITKCIAALRTLEGFDPSEKPKAFVVFKNAENREIFLNAVDDKDGSALIWLRIEMDNLT